MVILRRRSSWSLPEIEGVAFGGLERKYVKAASSMVLCCWPSFSRGKYRMRHPLQTERQSLFEQRNGVLLLFMRKDPPRTNNSYKALISGAMHGPSTDTIRFDT